MQEDGELNEDADFLGFNLYCAQIPRTTKGSKDYFYANEKFIEYWKATFNDECMDIDENKVIDLKDYIHTV